MPIIVVTGKEIEKIKGDYESYLSGLNMVGKIDYSQYSQLYDEGTKHIQRAYELGKSELERVNTELKCECRRCVYADSPCILSDYPSKDGVCSHYKNVFEENVELKQENKVLAQNLEDTEILNKTYEKRFSDLEKKNAELDCQKNRNKFCYSCANATERCFRNEIGCPCEKYKSYKDENAELKAFRQDCVKLTEDNVVMVRQRAEIARQLTKAKEIISEYINILKGDTKNWKKTQEKAEQFLLIK